MQKSYLGIGIFGSFVALAILAGCSSEGSDGGVPCAGPKFPGALPKGTVDVPYNPTDAFVEGGPIEAVPPPPGLDASLRGTPTKAGSYELTVTLTSSAGACSSTTESRKLTLVVEDSPAVCDSDVDCAFLHSALGGGECTTDSQCQGERQCVRLVDTGVCHKNSPGTLCGSGTRRLMTETMAGGSVITCVSDVERRKSCNERSHCVDVPLLQQGQPCSVGVECASGSCDLFDRCK